MNKVILVSILISFFTLCSFSQTKNDDIETLSELNNIKKKKRTFNNAKNNTNEVQLILSGLFVGYKKFISSQDGSKCAFHQTCSEYALVSIKKRGLIIGTINFFDRFTRCNTCSPWQYNINPVSRKFEDPAY